jgi:hypothetical protein
MAWVYSNRVPPLSPMKRWPASVKSTTSTVPAFPAGPVHDVLLHAFDARIGQQRDVETRRALGLAVEPQAW